MSTLFTTFTLLLFASNSTDVQPASKNYTELEAVIENFKGTEKAWIAIQEYRDKAKKDGNWERIADAYHYAIYEENGTDRLVYADSMVYAAHHTGQQSIIGEAYLTKGIMYYYQKDHLRAMDNFAIANSYIAVCNDDYLTYKVKYHIGLIKSYLGYYNEAIALFRQCCAFYISDDPYAYANSLHSLALCYSRTGSIGLSVKTAELASQVSKEIKYEKLTPYIAQLEGVNLFYKSDYSAAIQKLEHALKAIRQDEDFANEAVAYFYIGKAYKAIKRTDKAIAYFKKIDSIFMEKEYIHPELRESYELLIDYYTSRDEIKAALPYIRRLLIIDKELKENFQYLNQKVHKEYDTKELEDFKRKAEKQFALDKLYDSGFIIAIAALILTGTYTLYRQVTAKKRYRRRFENLMEKYNRDQPGGIKQKVQALPVGDAITEMILRCIDEFEQAFGFTQKELTATALAERFGTNSKYLSQVIRTYRHKNFTDYINGLRINYIMNRLRNEHRLRQYNTPALAEEAGFASTQHFTNTFKKETGMTPTFFAQEVERKLGTNTDGAGDI